MLKPSVEEMLNIGIGCGLEYVGEAYSNYMHHYDCFFLIDDIQKQICDFTNELKLASLTRFDDFDNHTIVDEKISDAINRLNFPVRHY